MENKYAAQSNFLQANSNNAAKKAVEDAIKSKTLENSPGLIGEFLSRKFKYNQGEIPLKDISEYLYSEPTGNALYSFISNTFKLNKPLGDAVRSVFSRLLPTNNPQYQSNLLNQFSKISLS